MKEKFGGLRGGTWSGWFSCEDGSKVRFIKKPSAKVILEREDGKRGEVATGDFAALMDAVGELCLECKRGKFEWLNFSALNQPTVVCPRCFAEYFCRAGKLEKKIPARERN